MERLWDIIKDRICNRAWEDLKEPMAAINEVSEDVVRRAMKRIDERSGLAWLAAELRDCIAPRRRPLRRPKSPRLLRGGTPSTVSSARSWRRPRSRPRRSPTTPRFSAG